MKCPECGREQHRVEKKRKYDIQDYRRKKCLSCGYRFSTEERIKRKLKVVRPKAEKTRLERRP